MKYKAVIWDLDGTLLNTLEDLMDSVNYGLKNHNMPCITLEQTRRFVGNGVAKLVERAVPEGTSEEETSQVLCEFKSYYDEHSKDKTRPYAGVVKVLEELKKKGIRHAIVSNKINEAVGPLAELYFPGLIDVAIGEKPDVPKKPAPDMIYEAIRRLGINKDEAVFIGDSEVDVATGVNSGLDMITVLWGFRDREELKKAGACTFVNEAEEIYKYINV